MRWRGGGYVDPPHVSYSIDPSRARVNCNARLNVKTDGPVMITLAGCGRTVAAG